MSKQAPERIWVQPWPNGAVGDCWHNATTETERTWEFNEYTRADLSQALVAAKLHEAMQLADRLYGADDYYSPHDVAFHILALIDTDHQASLDAYVRREVEKERDRCAKIADNMAARAEEQKERYRGGSNPWDRYRVLAAHYSNVATAIREAGHE